MPLEDREAVWQAFDAFEAGMDFADALHLARSASKAGAFATFDRRLARRADGAGLPLPVQLLS